MDDDIKIQGRVSANDLRKNLKPDEIILDAPNYDNSKAEIPNMEFLTNQLIDILSYANTDQMNDMRMKDKDGFKAHMRHKYQQFSDKYYGLLEMILNDEVSDITPLLKMFEIFQQSTDKTVGNKFDTYRESVAEQFLYPSFGGKAQYESKMKDAEKKAKKKANKKK